MTSRCDLTDLLVEQCAHCLGHTSVTDQFAAENTWLLVGGGWIRAEYVSRCARCSAAIVAGGAIRSVGYGRWIGACCGYDTDD